MMSGALRLHVLHTYVGAGIVGGSKAALDTMLNSPKRGGLAQCLTNPGKEGFNKTACICFLQALEGVKAIMRGYNVAR